MHRREFMVSTVAGIVGLGTVFSFARQKTSQPDLAALADANGFQLFNRTVSRLTDGSRTGVRLNESTNDGAALIPAIEFVNGTLECDIRGKDVQQQSFLGLAFHAVDGTTLDAVYFRPFNFRSADPDRRSHSVQYVAHPTYPWQKLRSGQPGKYEKAVSPVPDPNGWFHVRVVVESPKVSVFVADATEPSLVVDQLSDRKKGLVGFWVGNGSGGDFSNLKILHA
jgi:hypothetical protein